MNIFKKPVKVELKYDYSDISFEVLQSLMQYHDLSEGIDSITWNDLNMNRVFAKLMLTGTSSGDEILYHRLHSIDNKADFKSTIMLMQSNREQTEEITDKFKRIRKIFFDYKHNIKNGFKVKTLDKILYSLLSILPICLVILTIILKQPSIISFVFISMIINMSLYYKFLKKYQEHEDLYRYIYSILNCANFICNNSDYKAFDDAYKISSTYKNNKVLHKKLGNIFFIDKLDVIGDYLNIFFMIKPLNNIRAASYLKFEHKSLFELFDCIGNIDADIALYNFYMQNSQKLCFPEIICEKKIIANEIYNPLVENPIANSFEFDASIVITGSNMSGKSTFLRTLGINLLLAQSIGLAFAKGLKLPKLQLISSIDINDDILKGISYFMQEALAIKRMVENAQQNIPTLFLIDEIFKGTNPTERIAAAAEICLSLDTKNSMLVFATHDIDLLPLIPKYEKYYFTEDVGQREINFSYKINKGTASKRNAVKILKYLNYPQYIIENIYKRMDA